jgi:hypothetical protein
MAGVDWIFWKVTEPDDGQLSWLGITRPAARSAIDRDKMWTLIPRRRFFIANWYVTEDHLRSPGGQWAFENIDVADARDIVTDVPDPSADDIARITRPERILTLDQIDRFPVLKVMGKRADSALQERH